MGDGGAPQLEALEQELKRVADISAARVVAGRDGTVTEVHIISSSRRHPKQIVRDVESVALAEFGIDIDRRVVSVVQFDRLDAATGAGGADQDLLDDDIDDDDIDADVEADDIENDAATLEDGAEEDEVEGDDGESEQALEGDDAPDDVAVVDVSADVLEDAGGSRQDATDEEPDDTGSRYAIDSVSVHRTRDEYRVAVALRRPGSYITGSAVGFPVAASILQTVAEATLDALRKADVASEHFVLGRALLLPVDGLQLALATVVLVAPPTEEVLAGTAVVRGGEEAEAVVRAVLAATNRRLVAAG